MTRLFVAPLSLAFLAAPLATQAGGKTCPIGILSTAGVGPDREASE